MTLESLLNGTVVFFDAVVLWNYSYFRPNETRHEKDGKWIVEKGFN